MKLSIRDLLWLTLVCAVALGWLQSDRKRAAQFYAAITSRDAAIDAWKSNIANSLLRFKEAAIDPIHAENKPVGGQPVPADKAKYLRAHYELLGYLRDLEATSRNTPGRSSARPANGSTQLLQSRPRVSPPPQHEFNTMPAPRIEVSESP